MEFLQKGWLGKVAKNGLLFHGSKTPYQFSEKTPISDLDTFKLLLCCFFLETDALQILYRNGSCHQSIGLNPLNGTHANAKSTLSIVILTTKVTSGSAMAYILMTSYFKMVKSMQEKVSFYLFFNSPYNLLHFFHTFSRKCSFVLTNFKSL